MRCEEIGKEACAELIGGWLENLPACIASLMEKEAAADLNGLISENGLPLMVFTADEKLNGIYDVHLFCPRRIKRFDLFEGMRVGKDWLFSREGTRTLLFTVLSKQTQLKESLLTNGAVWTGWKYIESGNVFEHWVVQK